MRPKEECGKRYGRLVVLERSGADKHGNARFLTRCDCGTERVIIGMSLRNGDATSCGCRRAEASFSRIDQVFLKHGHARAGKTTSEYRSWYAMIKRCQNPKSNDFHNYGGRGITVCASWRASFEAFLSDMGLKPSPKHSIDRIDNDGNYEPGNCRWATALEQARNKRTTEHHHATS